MFCSICTAQSIMCTFISSLMWYWMLWITEVRWFSEFVPVIVLDGLMHWLIDRSVDGLIYGWIDWSINWLIERVLKNNYYRLAIIFVQPMVSWGGPCWQWLKKKLAIIGGLFFSVIIILFYWWFGKHSNFKL